MRKLRILHIANDEKFFDGVYDTFLEDDRLSNEAVLVAFNKDYKYIWIKNTNRVELLYSRSLVKQKFQGDTYDVIYFHSLGFDLWRYFKYIPKNKTVIWWLYGFEIYFRNFGIKPIYPIELLKPITRGFNNTKVDKMSWNIRTFIKYIYYSFLKDSVISRIDYFQPIYSIEYDYMKSVRGFRAEEFYNNNSLFFNIEPVTGKKKDGSIFLGNSSSDTNNHADILNKLQSLTTNKIIIPMSYGDFKYRDELEDFILNNHIKNVQILKVFLPKDEYFQMIDDSSYFIFGVMRQQASENLYSAISKGLKVFLYRDSVAYKHFRNCGYYVYAIEDMTVDSLKTPLSDKQIVHNQSVLKKEKDYCDSVYENVIQKLVAHYC